MDGKRPKIFISYSHRDRKALERLQNFLLTLERTGLIDSWDDTRLEGGDDWKFEIDNALDAANAAVLFISQDFLASEFIYKEELPTILAHAHAGKLKVIPVFLNPSNVEDLEFPFVYEGQERRDKLTRFQGFGTPAKTLAELSWSDRERAYTALSKRIKALAGEVKAAESASSFSTLPGHSPQRTTTGPANTPSHEHHLTVHLERRGDRLDAHYYLPGTDAIASGTRSWNEVSKELEPIGKLLDDGDAPALTRFIEQTPDKRGSQLFNLLFGSESEWEKVLRILLERPDGPRPNPILAPVRLRICTEAPLLLGLPWRLTAWHGHLLVASGWEFMTSQVIDPTDDYATRAPCNVLIVAPQTEVDGVAPDAGHPQAVIDVLKKVWPTGDEPGYVRVVRTRQELKNALWGMRPHLIYVYGYGTVMAGQSCLSLEEKRGVDALRLTELADLFKELQPRPALIYLNVAGLTDSGVAPSQILGVAVPLVIWHRLPTLDSETTSRAITWLNRWLQNGEDPVRSLHKINKQDVTAEAATIVLHSNYRTWKTQIYQRTALRERLSYLALDRDHQKALLGKHLTELVRSDSRRVMALVAYAAPGNLLGSLHEQLQYYLDLAVSDLAEIGWQRLQFPIARENLLRDLEEELKLQLRADNNEPVSHLLRRHAPKVVGTRKRGILWLNWGVFGAGVDQQEPLKPAQLGAWLRFSSEFLGNHCPDDLRIVCYAAIELREEAHPRLSQVLHNHLRQPWCRRSEFRLSDLPPLEKVSEYELFNFLEDSRNSNCDSNIHSEMAQRLIEKTGGEFEAIARLIQEAEDGSWYDLRDRLRDEQGTELPKDEEPLE